MAFLPSIDFGSAKKVRAAIRATILAHYRSGGTDWVNDELAKDIVALLASRVALARKIHPRADRKADDGFRSSSDAELTDY